MDFAQVQVVKVAILAIVVGTLVVLGIAYTEGVFNKPADPPYEGYPDTLTVEENFNNKYPARATVYLENADGTDSVCVDDVGVYDLPDNPVMKVVVNPLHSVGTFGSDVYIYQEGLEYSYEITTDYLGASIGDVSIDGQTVIFSLTPVYGNSTITSKFPMVFSKSITLYYPNYDNLSYEMWFDSNIPETLENLKITPPSGKTLDYWSYYEDGSGEHLTPGDTSKFVPFGVSLYAQWKEAGPPAYPTTFVVSEEYANTFTGVVDLYFDSLSESNPKLINEVGSYDLPEYPILRAVLKDSSQYSLGIFDGRPLIYRAGEGSSYEVMTAINCCSDATVFESDATSCSILLVPGPGDEMSYMAPSIYAWTNDYYFLNNSTLDLVSWASDHAETAETLGITPPAGKVLDCWTLTQDGTGTKFTPGSTDVIPRGLFLYAQWKDA